MDDQYKALAYESLNQWKELNRQFLLGLTIVCSVAGVLLTAYLCAAAGHKRDREGLPELVPPGARRPAVGADLLRGGPGRGYGG